MTALFCISSGRARLRIRPRRITSSQQLLRKITSDCVVKSPPVVCARPSQRLWAQHRQKLPDSQLGLTCCYLKQLEISIQHGLHFAAAKALGVKIDHAIFRFFRVNVDRASNRDLPNPPELIAKLKIPELLIGMFA